MFGGSKKPDEPEPEPRAPDEREIVLSNVEKLLRDECGFNPWQAASLAEAGVDWHYAKKLIDRGCSHEVALDILLP